MTNSQAIKLFTSRFTRSLFVQLLPRIPLSFPAELSACTMHLVRDPPALDK
jgi:hypothetical protein